MDKKEHEHRHDEEGGNDAQKTLKEIWQHGRRRSGRGTGRAPTEGVVRPAISVRYYQS
jgi:hypothetical protein